MSTRHRWGGRRHDDISPWAFVRVVAVLLILVFGGCEWIAGA